LLAAVFLLVWKWHVLFSRQKRALPGGWLLVLGLVMFVSFFALNTMPHLIDVEPYADKMAERLDSAE
jgi:ABC-type uncharacterized transport system permease subunit